MPVIIQIPKGHHIIEIIAGVHRAPPSIRCACNPLAVYGGGETALGGVAELYAIHIANVVLEAAER